MKVRVDGADPIPTEVVEVIDLFRSELAEVHFADISAEVLDEQAEVVRQRAEAVDKARAALEAARAALEAAQSGLTQAARRAVAYARVYAEGDEALTGRITALRLEAEPGAKAKKIKKRRSRKRSADAASPAAEAPDPRIAELPFEGVPSEAQAP